MIDMHIHTNHSDGTFSVKEVLEKSEKLGLEYISITDHDNCFAYNELETMNVKEYYSGKIIPGIEIKCFYRGRLIEVLGYNYNIEKMNNWIDNFYKDKQRKDVQTKYFNMLYEDCIKLGLKMSPKEMILWNPEKDWASFTIYKEMKKHEENEKKLPEDLWQEFTTFTKKYCADKTNIFYIDKSNDYPSLEEAIDGIRLAEGIVIIAHVFIYKWAKDKEEMIENIHNNYDIDGFECYHSNFSEEQINYMIKYCKNNNLLMSGGSDCHGANKPGIELAVGKGNLNIDEAIIKNWVDISS